MREGCARFARHAPLYENSPSKIKKTKKKNLNNFTTIIDNNSRNFIMSDRYIKGQDLQF